MEILEYLKYIVAGIVGAIAFYIVMRIGSSAIFRSYFVALKRSGHLPKKE